MLDPVQPICSIYSTRIYIAATHQNRVNLTRVWYIYSQTYYCYPIRHLVFHHIGDVLLSTTYYFSRPTALQN